MSRAGPRAHAARAVVVAAALAMVGSGTGYAEAVDPSRVQPEGSSLAKKDRERATKSAKHGRLPKVGSRPAPVVNLYNSWTHEWLAVEPGQRPDRATVDRFLRDHFTNAPSSMEPRLIQAVMQAAKKFRTDVVIVVSAFRHPKYNLMLRKKGRQVARDSQHTHGTAIDFYLPKIPTLSLHAWAKQQRLGGVGLYTGSGFIHMDTGPVRYWNGE